MQPGLHVVTLAAGDLPRALAFYRDGLGWPVAKERAGYAYFALPGGPWLALCDRRLLRDELGDVAGGASVVSQNVRTREEVDAAVTAASRAGARIARVAADRAWGGRSGSFADPDGHIWEITWNPRATFDADGRIASFG